MKSDKAIRQELDALQQSTTEGQLDTECSEIQVDVLPPDLDAADSRYFLIGSAHLKAEGAEERFDFEESLEFNGIPYLSSPWVKIPDMARCGYSISFTAEAYAPSAMEVIEIDASEGPADIAAKEIQGFDIQDAEVSFDDDGDALFKCTVKITGHKVVACIVMPERDTDLYGSVVDDDIEIDEALYEVKAGGKFYLMLAEYKLCDAEIAYSFTGDAKSTDFGGDADEEQDDDADFDEIEESDDIYVRFALSKGEGEWPELSELNEEERNSPLLMTKFYLDWNPLDDSLDGVEVEEVELIYDGVTRLEESDDGLYIGDDGLEGHPGPVLRFRLSHEVPVDDFRRSVFQSSMSLCPGSRGPDGDAFHFEDQNGYTSVIAPGDVQAIQEVLQENGVTYAVTDFAPADLSKGLQFRTK